jgi:hemerythrin-like domain-containing protein
LNQETANSELPGPELPEPELPRVLQWLFQEHRHMAALITALEGKASGVNSLTTSDYYLMRDIVAYLHDYPDQVHHPTENRLFTKLLQRRPSLKKSINRLQSDHEAVAIETKNLLDLLEGAIDDPGEELELEIRESCQAFVNHQRTHMGFENQQMFPEAIDNLSPQDWSQLESEYASQEDPLFGHAVGSNHRLLYEYLLKSPTGSPGKLSIALGLFSLERWMMTAEIMEQSLGSWCDRMVEMRDEVSAETRAVVVKTLKPEGLGSTMGLPIRYAGFLGKTFLGCGNDLLQIYASTTKNTLALFINRNPGS